MKEDIREDMKLGRTREGTIFEIVSALLIIIMWVVSMRLVSSHGADKEQMVINCVIATASVFAMLLASYRPAFLNIPVTITTPAQLRLLIRLERIAALEVIAILFGINLAMALDGREAVVLVVVMAACAVILTTAICGVFIISKRGI